MTSYFAPLRGHIAEPLALDMQSLFLSGRVLPFGAKLNVTHAFRSSEKTPVEVVYCFPLPRDASLVSFQISGETFSISSRLENRLAAGKRYEQALEDGSLAALTQQNLDGLVNLTVGNLRPGETVLVRLELVTGISLSDSGFRLRFPSTVAPCYHSQMRVSLDRPGVGTIELPDRVSGGVFLPPFHADASDLHRIGFELQVEPADAIGEIASPSHAVRVLLNKRSAIGVNLSPDRDVPNRDLVLDVKCDFGAGLARSDQPSGDRKHFAAIVPSTAFGQPAGTARRIVFLLDRSGSMEGSPIKQARHAIENCLANLSPEDQFGIVAFDSRVEQFRPAMLPATRENVEEACAFLPTVDARGGTELAKGIEAAAQLLAGSTGEILVITDGQVVETSKIVQWARKFEVRLFCLGIGSASQDRFLELLARQTGGICRFVTPSERVDAAALEVFAAIGGTVAAEVHIANANILPASTGTVFSGTPFVTFGDIEHNAASIAVDWPDGARRLRFEALGAESNGLIAKLRGAKLIADFETRDYRSDTTARQQLLELSKVYGLASSEMSLVAVVERADDQAGQVPKTKIVPVGMPWDTEFESYFGNESRALAGPLFARMAPAPRFAHAPLYSSRSMHSFDVLVDCHAAGDVLALVREAIRIIEEYVLTGASKDMPDQVSVLTSALVTEQSQVKDQSHRAVLSALISFLLSEVRPFIETGTLNLVKWAAVRRQLENTWPELTKCEVRLVQG